MEWLPPGRPLGLDPYPNPSPSFYSLESSRARQDYPTNPPWALRSQHDGATDAGPTTSSEVPLYPPPWNPFNQPRSEHHSPAELSPHTGSWIQQADLQSSCNSSFESYPNYWGSQHMDHAPFGGTTMPSQPFSYPPSNFPNTLSPHDAFPASTVSPSAPPPPSDNCPPAPPQGHIPSAPAFPSGGSGLSFGGKPPSAHPLLESVEDDFVPYEEDQSDGEEDVKTGYDDKFDYSHKALEKYGTNLTTRAKEGSFSPVIGRDAVIQQCIEILTRKSKCNPVLVGHAGVGKTAVVEGLAQRIVKGDVPEPLRQCKIISVDFQNVTGGTQYRGQFEMKMKELMDEATEAKRKVILFLDELHRVIGAGKVTDQVDTGSEILKPALARGDFLCIGATTFDEYTKYVEQDQALSRRFQKVVVDPPSPQDTISILRGLKPSLEAHHGISIADDALAEAVKLSERYIPDRFLPDKAIDLVDGAASKLKIMISKPPILDEIERAILELDMERLAVTSPTGGTSSQARLYQILSDLEGLKLRQANLNRKWKKEKALATRIVSLKEKITAAKTGSKASSSDEVHSFATCCSCEKCPITGPRYTHNTENHLDLCMACHKALKEFGTFEFLSPDMFHLVKPNFGLTCTLCSIRPIIGTYYRCTTDMRLVYCHPCCSKAILSYPSLTFMQYDNGPQSEQSNDNSATTTSKELEAQLETAEKEWNEYKTTYKPLIQLEVTSTTIAEVVSSRTGIPVAKMQASQMHQLLQLDAALHKRVIGQDEACNAIARAVQRSRAGLSDPNRPIASLMFMGPTGVGKTELAKALAAHLFNSENAMVRIDMSEYGDKSSISRLTGAAPGLVGHGSGGQLTTPVRRQPYSVVLFDEIEKADDDIFNIFLQILDDGRLTDSEGRVVNFTNTVIIMTSNVGAELILDLITKDEAYQVMKSQVVDAARAKYRPEFTNRIDEFIVFQPLNPQQICEIVKLQLERVSKRLQDRQINLQVSASAIQVLSTMGYDPRYGARPVKRVIQQNVEDPLAQGILRGEYRDGCTVMVDTEFSSLDPSQQKLTFYKLS